MKNSRSNLYFKLPPQNFCFYDTIDPKIDILKYKIWLLDWEDGPVHLPPGLLAEGVHGPGNQSLRTNNNNKTNKITNLTIMRKVIIISA